MKQNKTSQASGTQTLEDLGQVLSGLFGTLLSGRGQLREQAQKKMELLAHRLPYVRRDEFDALHAMLQKARLEQESLKARLDRLEGKSGKNTVADSVKTPASKKTKKTTAPIRKSSPSRNNHKARKG